MIIIYIIKSITMKRKPGVSLFIQFLFFFTLMACSKVSPPDIIILNGKIVTVDKDFSIA